MLAVMFEFANRIADRSPPLNSTSTASPFAMFNTLSVRALISSREYIAPKRILGQGRRSRGEGSRVKALGFGRRLPMRETESLCWDVVAGLFSPPWLKTPPYSTIQVNSVVKR